MSKPAHSRAEYKAIAQRIAKDAPQIVKRLRAGEYLPSIAKDYGVSRVTFWRYAQRVIDGRAWMRLMKVGNPRPRKARPIAVEDLDEVREEAGPTCYNCTRPRRRWDTVCPYCDTRY